MALGRLRKGHTRTDGVDAILYTVHMEISATESRKRLFQLFDAADRGEQVRIVRRAVVYRLAVERPTPRTRSSKITVEWLDPVVESGQWTFEPNAKGGFGFTRRR